MTTLLSWAYQCGEKALTLNPSPQGEGLETRLKILADGNDSRLRHPNPLLIANKN